MKNTITESMMQKMLDVYLGRPPSGTPDEIGYIKMMLNNDQGSTGVEEMMARILNIEKLDPKHGFDAIDYNNNQHVEFKPTTTDYPTATYNDVTPKKIDDLMATRSSLVYEVHHLGELMFMASVSGKHASEMLRDKYNAKLKKIKDGENIGTRQTHTLSLLSLVNKYGKDAVNVMFINAKWDISKNYLEKITTKVAPHSNLNLTF